MLHIKERLKRLKFVCAKSLSHRLLSLYSTAIKWSEPAYQAALFDLTPTAYADNVDPYLRQLSELIENRAAQVHEIAVTGPYSSGKTSLLKTFARLNPQYNYTWISLANFKSWQGSNDNQNLNPQSPELQSLEKSIVQQLLYRARSDKVSGSRFRRIAPKKISPTVTSIVVVWILALAFLYVSNSLSWTGLLEAHTFPVLSLLSFVLGVGILLLRDILQALQGLAISKFSFSKVEVVFSGKNDSVFNQYLEEIIYHLEANNTDIVIFEDLDRFRDNAIFTKLKELNTILNHSADVTRPIRFIYAVQDDIFKFDDRAKFFDAIVPVIPIAHQSNAYPIFRDLLEQAGLKDEFDDNMLREIMIYIDDMRILKNIVNEFVLYRSLLSPHMKITDRVQDQLLCFIIYKNKYCDDFATLHKSKGLLVDLFSAARKVRQELRKHYDGEILQLKELLQSAHSEVLDSIEELNMVFLLKVAKEIEPNGAFALHTIQRIDMNEIVKPDKFSEMINLENINAQSNRSNQNITNPFKKLQNKDHEYQKRLAAIKAKQRSHKHALQFQLQETHDKSALSSALPIQSLCSQHGNLWKDATDGILQDDKNRLLQVLVENDYLDEHYQKFIAIFKAGHISSEDHQFILSVNNNTPLDPGQLVMDPNTVFQYLKNSRLHNKAFFNYSLIDYLLENNQSTPLKTMLKLLASQSSFVHTYWTSVNQLKQSQHWVDLVMHTLEGYWAWLIQSELPDEDKHDLLVRSLVQLPIESTDSAMSDTDKPALQQYLRENAVVLNNLTTETKPREHLLNVLDALEIQFQLLEGVQPDVVKDVFTIGLYKATPENVLTIYNARNDSNDLDNLYYDAIKKDDELYHKIEEHRELACKWVLDDQLIVDSVEGWLDFLNHPNVPKDSKRQLVLHSDCMIDSIQSVSDSELWLDLITKQKMACDWDNVLACLDAVTNDPQDSDVLARYLNDPSVIETLTGVAKEELKEEGRQEIHDFILGDSIEIEPFKKYENYLCLYTAPDAITELSIEKLSHLIRGPAGKSVEFSHSEHNSLSYIDLIDKQLKCHGFDLLSQVQLKTSQPAQMLGMVR